MKHFTFLTVLLVTSTLFAQEAPKPVEPTKEHQWLGKLVGKWDCEFECIFPGQPQPVKFKGSENIVAVGKLWVVSEGECGDDTMKVHSRLTLGYDAQKKKYVGTWIDSMQTTMWKSGQEIPFFVLPSLGGGHNMRGYESYRFRDRNSQLVQAEWRVMVSRFMDTAFFYDAGKVATDTADLDLSVLTHDYGVGVRFHSPLTTLFRVDLAKSPEGLRLVFAGSAPF